MTPDIVVDIGNTRIKWGWSVPQLRGMRTLSLPPDDPVSWEQALLTVGRPVVLWAAASVHPERLAAFCRWVDSRGDQVVALDHHSQIPIPVEVDEPDRVGIDRLLNAVAFVQTLPAGTPGVVIDVGTAATVDLVNSRHVFVGGAILPGPRLMFESLHRQTAKLPFIDLHEVPDTELPGANTRAAMSVGVMAALTGGCEYLVRKYREQCERPPWVLTTGGALGSLADHKFHAGENTRTRPTLTLEGIRIAAEALP